VLAAQGEIRWQKSSQRSFHICGSTKKQKKRLPSFASRSHAERGNEALWLNLAPFVSVTLSGQPFVAISAGPFFKLNEAISFIVYCDTQEEIDYYWAKLSAVPESEQCGWLKDKYGLSWQIVPTVMAKMLQDHDFERLARVTQAFLKMKKFDLAALEMAFEGK
jgi:predicted 3-demethylubiquinone-9 3-methyltransferase (glyoxalase superfamily)